ncbi:EpsG family protein [uncultured Brachyspira sp.]|uniref:EpsG family protein n=1 Tax=uncultured Brachyspira sp. TaxID=221953 RepID=UPI0026077A81|nr:EpsG family protein [uncultured Brachyspira sp.]
MFTFIVAILTFNIKTNNSFNIKNKQDIAIIIIVLVAILRFDVGYDYPVYYEMAQTFSGINIDRCEPLSKLIIYIAYCCDSPPLMFVMFGLLSYSFYFSTIKKYSKDISISIISFIAFIFVTDLGNIRQSLAVAICFWGYRFIINKSVLKYIITCIIAMLFHTSAIFAIPIYFLYNKFNINHFILLILVLAFSFNILIDEFATLGLYANYLEVLNDYEGGGIIKYAIIGWLVLFILIDIFHKNLKRNLPFYFIIIIGTLIPFFLNGHFGGRVARYYLIYLCLLVPNVLYYVKAKMKFVVCSVLLSYFLVFIYVDYSNTMALTPYKNVLFINTENPNFKTKLN